MLKRSRILSAVPEAPAVARRFVRQVAAGHVPSSVLADAYLLTSELVSNAVLHGSGRARDTIRLTVSVDDRLVRVGVQDRGRGFDPRRPYRGRGPGGWGLKLVRKLASRWGIAPGEAGTAVWFELETRRAAAESLDRQRDTAPHSR